MKVDLKIDTAPLIGRLTNAQRELANSTVRAINNTLRHIQKAEIENVDAEFTLRDPAFFKGTPNRPGGVAARISPFASVGKGRLYGEVAIAQASTIKSQRRLLLSVFEQGGERKPGKASVIPITGGPARPAFGQKVPRDYTLAGLGLRAFKKGRKELREVRGSNGRVRRKAVTLFGEFGRLDLSKATPDRQFKGRNRTFLIPGVGIYQRTGTGKRSSQKVYSIRSGVRLTARLGWTRVARATADRWFKEELQIQTIKALQRSRGKGL